jgi:hypothetical protein
MNERHATIEMAPEGDRLFSSQVLRILDNESLPTAIELEQLILKSASFADLVKLICSQEAKKFFSSSLAHTAIKHSVVLEKTPRQNLNKSGSNVEQFQLQIDSTAFGPADDFFRQDIILRSENFKLSKNIGQVSYYKDSGSLYIHLPEAGWDLASLFQIRLDVVSGIERPIRHIFILNDSCISTCIASFPEHCSLHVYSQHSFVETIPGHQYCFNELVLVSKNNLLRENTKLVAQKALILATDVNILEKGVAFPEQIESINLLSYSLNCYIGAIDEKKLPEPSFRMLNISHENSGLIDQVQQLSVVNVNAISCFANNRPTGLSDSFSAQEESLGTSMINKPSVSCGAFLFGAGVLLLAASAFYMYKEKNVFVATALACGSIVFGCMGVSIFAALNCALILLDKLNLRNFSIDSASAAYMRLTQLNPDESFVQPLLSQREAQEKGKGARYWCSWGAQGDEARERENSLDPSSAHSAGSAISLLYRSDSQNSLYRGESNESPRDGEESKAYASDVCEV